MLNFDPITIVITLINLALLFFVLKAIFFKPVTQFIAARTAKIKAELEKSARDREDAASLLSAYQEKLKHAEGEAALILKTARENAEKRSAQMVADARSEAAALIAAAQKQIAAERQAASFAFKAEASQLVLAAAAKLLKREIAGEDALRLSEQALTECALSQSSGRRP
ncbi:MAG: ATP synthase F0 subunit B [Spirochaetaceae bacterium]|jgi:F-type H+-transporting ATPase subunit b|nr:ATP synthase F0 subunit B [Spirochaetaceae bacterium]